MRILILNWRDLKHPRAGGSEVYSQNLAKHWSESGHDVTFFCAAVAGQPAQEVVDGYRLVRRGSALSVYREARLFFAAEDPFDVVLDVVNTRPFMTPRWAGRTPTLALIHQVAREAWAFELPAPAAALGRYVLEPRWLSAYQGVRVLTVSASSRDSLHEYGLRHVSVVPEGGEPPLPRPLPPKASGPTWLLVGRLTPNKRPDHAVLAHRRLLAELPDAVLQVAGDGPMADRVRALGVPQVQFLGRVDEATKQDLMSAAHAVIGTAVREGWGLTISEAARLGTRAIGYDVPGLRDSISAAGGVLVQPTPDALAAAAAEYLPRWMHEGRADLGSAGVRMWNEVADIILDHVQSAVADGPGALSPPPRRRRSTATGDGESEGLPQPRVGIVVPTRNSARTLRACLESLLNQTERPKIVVVDNHSSDETASIAGSLADSVLVAGPERSAQRNAGAAALDTPIIAYIDSDMELEPEVVSQAADLIDAGAGGVIVPESSFGDGFWASVRAFERSFYDGDDSVEAARFFSRSVLAQVGGYDEAITGPEDWDLSMRVRAVAQIERTTARIWHDEGSVTFTQLLSKKGHYAEGIGDFGAKHGGGTLLRLLDRPYFRRPWELLWPRPAVGLGVVALKLGEGAAVAQRLSTARIRAAAAKARG